MKKFFQSFLVLSALLTVLFCLGGCGAQSDEDGIVVKTIENIDKYTIVRSDISSSLIQEAAQKLCMSFLKKTDAKISSSTDLNDEKTYEVIIGKTNRNVEGFDYDGLALNEYLIKLVGNKIVIAGGSDRMTAAAVESFMTNFITDGSVRVPTGNGYSYTDPSYYSSIKIEGIPINEYAIISALYYDSVAEKFADTLLETASVSLPVIKSEEAESYAGKYILLDDTNTDFSSYSVTVEDGNVIMFANYVTIEKCIDYFISDMLDYDMESEKIKGATDLNITAADSGSFTEEKSAVYTKEKLMEVLGEVYNDNDSLIIAQQITEHMHPVGEAVEIERRLYKEECGVDVPMFGYDLGTLEAWDTRRTENGVVKEAYDLIEFMREGGIVTFSLHLDNPGPQKGEVDHYRGELDMDEWDELLTEGTEINANFMETLEFIGDFLEIFKINEAPVILRPLHEMNGNWFWFCIVSGKDDYTLPQSYAKDLWVLIYDYFVNDRGVDNMLWEYSPNVAGNGNSQTLTNVMYCYPGDEYVDLVSADWYTTSKVNTTTFETSAEALASTGKIFSMSEFGPSGDLVTDLDKSPEYKFTCTDLDNMITSIREKEIKVAYWLLWSSYQQVKISMWNMGDAEFFYENDVYLTLEDTYELLYK